MFTGRRINGVTLPHILQFTTGASDEPGLGFIINPSIVFIDATTSFIPTANTCICCLNLPLATHQIHLANAQNRFPLYDLAFVNAFFDHV